MQNSLIAYVARLPTSSRNNNKEISYFTPRHLNCFISRKCRETGMRREFTNIDVVYNIFTTISQVQKDDWGPCHRCDGPNEWVRVKIRCNDCDYHRQARLCLSNTLRGRASRGSASYTRTCRPAPTELENQSIWFAFPFSLRLFPFPYKIKNRGRKVSEKLKFETIK